jgi:hypothetical protein
MSLGGLALLGDADLEVGVVGDCFHDGFSCWFESPRDGVPVAFLQVEPSTTHKDDSGPGLGFDGCSGNDCNNAGCCIACCPECGIINKGFSWSFSVDFNPGSIKTGWWRSEREDGEC